MLAPCQGRMAACYRFHGLSSWRGVAHSRVHEIVVSRQCRHTMDAGARCPEAWSLPNCIWCVWWIEEGMRIVGLVDLGVSGPTPCPGNVMGLSRRLACIMGPSVAHIASPVRRCSVRRYLGASVVIFALPRGAVLHGAPSALRLPRASTAPLRTSRCCGSMTRSRKPTQSGTSTGCSTRRRTTSRTSHGECRRRSLSRRAARERFAGKGVWGVGRRGGSWRGGDPHLSRAAREISRMESCRRQPEDDMVEERAAVPCRLDDVAGLEGFSWNAGDTTELRRWALGREPDRETCAERPACWGSRIRARCDILLGVIPPARIPPVFLPEPPSFREGHTLGGSYYYATTARLDLQRETVRGGRGAGSGSEVAGRPGCHPCVSFARGAMGSTASHRTTSHRTAPAGVKEPWERDLGAWRIGAPAFAAASASRVLP